MYKYKVRESLWSWWIYKVQDNRWYPMKTELKEGLKMVSLGMAGTDSVTEAQKATAGYDLLCPRHLDAVGTGFLNFCALVIASYPE